MGESAKTAAMTPAVLLAGLCFSVYFLSLLFRYVSLPTGLMPVPSSSSSCCFRPCSSYEFLFSLNVVLVEAFLVCLHHILHTSSRRLGISSYFCWCYGLACFVVLPYPVR